MRHQGRFLAADPPIVLVFGGLNLSQTADPAIFFKKPIQYLIEC